MMLFFAFVFLAMLRSMLILPSVSGVPDGGPEKDLSVNMPSAAAQSQALGSGLPRPSEALKAILREKNGDVHFRLDSKSTHESGGETARCMLGSRGAVDSSPASVPAVVAVGFFGMSRNLSRTAKSIRKHVFEVLDRENIHYDVFWSTMYARKLTSVRSGELNVTLNPLDYSLLQRTFCSVNVYNQANIRPRLFDHYRTRTHHDPWQDEYVSLKNVLGSYYSQLRLWDQIAEQQSIAGRAYDAIVVMRPDTAILNDIDLPRFLPVLSQLSRSEVAYRFAIAEADKEPLGIGTKKEDEPLGSALVSLRSLWVPPFHAYLGFNDRLAFGSVVAMRTYLTRGTAYLDAMLGFNESQGRICRRDGVHRNTGECFLGLVAAAAGLDVRSSELSPLRIRSDGSLPAHDSGPGFEALLPPSARAAYRRCVQPDRATAATARGLGRRVTKKSNVRRWVWMHTVC